MKHAYEIRLQEQIDIHWQLWFNVTVEHIAGETSLRGEFDQAQLQALLRKIHHLGCTLRSLRQLPPQQEICL